MPEQLLWKPPQRHLALRSSGAHQPGPTPSRGASSPHRRQVRAVGVRSATLARLLRQEPGRGDHHDDRQPGRRDLRLQRDAGGSAMPVPVIVVAAKHRGLRRRRAARRQRQHHGEWQSRYGNTAGQRVAHPHPAARRGRSRSSSVPLRQKGGHLDPSAAHRVVKRAAARAGLPPAVSAHWLRHAHASHT